MMRLLMYQVFDYNCVIHKVHKGDFDTPKMAKEHETRTR